MCCFIHIASGQAVKTLGEALAACTSADDWDAEKSHRWWADHVQTALVDAMPRPAPEESS